MDPGLRRDLLRLTFARRRSRDDRGRDASRNLRIREVCDSGAPRHDPYADRRCDGPARSVSRSGSWWSCTSRRSRSGRCSGSTVRPRLDRPTAGARRRRAASSRPRRPYPMAPDRCSTCRCPARRPPATSWCTGPRYPQHKGAGRSSTSCTVTQARRRTCSMPGCRGLIDRLVAEGYPPFVLAAPDGNGLSHRDTEWANAVDGTDQFETFVTGNVIRAVEGSHLRDRTRRAIAGFWIGGSGRGEPRPAPSGSLWSGRPDRGLLPRRRPVGCVRAPTRGDRREHAGTPSDRSASRAHPGGRRRRGE